MPLVGIKEILVDARKKNYGIPCMLAGNLEMIIGQIKAAEAKQSPLILAYNVGVTPQVPMELAMPLIVNAASQAKVPVASILDHGQSLEVAVQAINLGSSSVMFDGSPLPYEENVKQTQEVVRVAHAVGVSVEAELGSIGGSSVEIGMNYELDSSRDPADYFTNPQMAADFVERTGVDVLAISFGNAHGPYRGDPNLDLDRVREIYNLVDVPLVMHGASGLTNDDYGRIIAGGISKINYYSAMARSASQNLKRTMMAADDETIIYHETIAWGIDYFYTETQKLLDLLGCTGKAI